MCSAYLNNLQLSLTINQSIQSHSTFDLHVVCISVSYYRRGRPRNRATIRIGCGFEETNYLLLKLRSKMQEAV